MRSYRPKDAVPCIWPTGRVPALQRPGGSGEFRDGQAGGRGEAGAGAVRAVRRPPPGAGGGGRRGRADGGCEAAETVKGE